MPSKEEKRRRAELVEAMVKKDTEEAIERMPISFSDLAALFDHLDEQLGELGCDHTPKMTKAFLKKKKLNTETILPWLEEYGGCCDCEILANVEESWESEIEKTHNKSFKNAVQKSSPARTPQKALRRLIQTLDKELQQNKEEKMKSQLFAILALLSSASILNAASITIADPSGSVSYHESTPDSNTIVYGIGVYETSIGRGFREHPIGTGNIEIENQGSHQSILVLSSYEPTNWNITGTGINSISSIYLFGYHDQSVTIGNSNIDIFEFSYLGEGNYQGITYEWNTPEIQTFENIVGDNIDVFAGAYHATDFTIQAVPVPPALLLFMSGIIGLFGITKRRSI